MPIRFDVELTLAKSGWHVYGIGTSTRLSRRANRMKRIPHYASTFSEMRLILWALRKILRIPYTRHITNDEVRSRSNYQPLSCTVTSRRLRFFGHIARSSPDEDHHRAIAAAIRKPPPDWRRPTGTPSYTWLRSVEADLRPLNIGLSSAWRKVSGRADGGVDGNCRCLATTAKLITGQTVLVCNKCTKHQFIHLHIENSKKLQKAILPASH